MAQIAVLGHGQELGARGDRHPGQEFVRVVLALLHDQLALDLLEFPQQHQAGHHVRRHHVQVAEEVAEQPGDVGKRVLRAQRVITFFFLPLAKNERYEKREKRNFSVVRFNLLNLARLKIMILQNF